jgi:hypothetical protein
MTALNQTMANDNIYLVNYSNGGSAMCLYTNKAWSVDGESPDQTALLAQAPAFTTWEGTPQSGALWLPFTTSINANAIQQPAGTQVGTAKQFRKSMIPSNIASIPSAQAWAIYTIFRDNGRVLYTDPVLGNAISLYVCADVSFCPIIVEPLEYWTR